MKALRNRLMEVRTRLAMPWDVIERDYALSLVLEGMSKVESINRSLVFKGGTALKKCYFGDYRFSEDLDFSAGDSSPRGRELEVAVANACAHAVRFADQYAPIEVISERYEERLPHPRGQEAFKISVRLPWHRAPSANVLVEVTTDERIFLPVRRRKVLHEYGETFSAKVPVYALEEIVAEKLRGVLQYERQLEQRGWARSRSRDYYDVWRVLAAHRGHMKLTHFAGLLHEKCSLRQVSFRNHSDFFRPKVLSHVVGWAPWLTQTVKTQ